MPRLTLATCAHTHVRPYEAHGALVHGLCESCFKRVVKEKQPKHAAWREDAPLSGKCEHTNKMYLESRLTINKPHRNAMCMTCGAGLRAPSNSDEWKPLHEYRYIVKEWA